MIRRWEVLTGFPAPPATEIGPKGGRRLTAAFAEWLMGLPPGWVTDVIETRKEQLRCVGNGVVPQQALVAFALLMNAMNEESEEEVLELCS